MQNTALDGKDTKITTLHIFKLCEHRMNQLILPNGKWWAQGWWAAKK